VARIGEDVRENGDWSAPEPERGSVCLNCGARNAPGARFCASCGTPFREPDPQVIDVSSGEPHVVIHEDDRGPAGWQQWGTARVDQGRVYVARGGRRGCLLLNVLALLVFCCACWFLWSSVSWAL
jgi:hypothetical protein